MVAKKCGAHLLLPSEAHLPERINEDGSGQRQENNADEHGDRADRLATGGRWNDIYKGRR